MSKAAARRAQLSEQNRAKKKARALIHLAFLGGTISKAGDLKPKLEASLRKELIDQKIVGAVPQPRRGLALELEDAAGGGSWTISARQSCPRKSRWPAY